MGVLCVLWDYLWPLWLGLFLFFFSRRNKPAIFGIYQQPGRWFHLKYFMMLTLLKIRKYQNKKRTESEIAQTSGGAGYGLKSRTSPDKMDCIQPLSEHPKAIDAVFFSSANKDGFYFIVAMARRPHGVSNTFIIYRDPKLGVLVTPRFPDTLMFGDENVFAVEGLRLTPLKPMKKWKIQYEGKLKLETEPDKVFDVAIDAEFTTRVPHFDFDTDMSPEAVARGMAREPWSRDYFHTLKEAHQSHYEQMGNVRGRFVVDGEEKVINLDCMRDHSYAEKREWKYLHRYGLHNIYVEDGTKVMVGVVSQPNTFSQLELGYMNTPSGVKHPVTSCDIPLYYHGEKGTPPTDYSFRFTAGGDEHEVVVQVVELPEFYIGWEWECRVVERLVRYWVDGKEAWGTAEWQYRHRGGRPKEVAKEDPDWTRDINKG